MKQYLTGGKGRGCLWWASSQGEPRLWGIKERGGGGGGNENIKKREGGWSGLASGIPHVLGMVCFLLFLLALGCLMEACDDGDLAEQH